MLYHTELNEEFEKATDVEGDVGNEFPVLPVSLNCYPNVYRVGDPTRSSHFSPLPFFRREAQQQQQSGGDEDHFPPASSVSAQTKPNQTAGLPHTLRFINFS